MPPIVEIPYCIAQGFPELIRLPKYHVHMDGLEYKYFHFSIAEICF